MKITLLTGKTFKIEQAFEFEIRILRPATARRLTLRIDTRNRVPVLSIPPRCSAKKAIEFVESHRDWIINSLGKLPPQTLFANGNVISLLGKEYTISHHPRARSGEYIENDKLIVSGAAEFLHRRVKDFIKKTASEEFLHRSRKLAATIGCPLTGITLKDTRSRWGSCSSKNHINYNWRVALAPEFVIDYLIAHEVSHLKHQDHSPAFWNCVEDLCPDFAKGRRWLKQHGKSLYAYQ